MFDKKSKGRRGAVDKQEQQRQKSGLYGLFMMFVGALIATAVGAFFYFSPFLGERKSPALNESMEVVPLATDDKNETEYSFYEVLPKQNFYSIPEGISAQDRLEDAPEELRVDVVVQAPKEKTPNERNADDPNAANEQAADAKGEADKPTASIKIETTDARSVYVLQVRSYDNAAAADNRRAQVEMAGVQAEVIKEEINGVTLYTVVSKPFTNKNAAANAVRKLQAGGIDALVVEQVL